MDNRPTQQVQTILVYIDSNYQGILSGRFYNPIQGQCESFHSLAQLMLKIDRNLDDCQMPQAFHSQRSFSQDIRDSSWEESYLTPPGRKANFIIRVLFRRHSSWQGSVTWLETRQTQRFRSVLELMGLLESTLALDAPSYPLSHEA